MSGENKTWVAGLVGVAVGATVAVLIFLVSQPSASRDQATGAIGAAERYRSEQIKQGDTGISGATSPTGQVSTGQVAEMLGRAAAERQAEALNKAALELKDAMWANATPLEKVNAYLRADPGTQRMIANRMDPSGRAVFEKALADRAASDRAAQDVVGKVSAETWGKAALELKDAMWANATPLEKVAAYLRADPGTQRMIANRMDPSGRAVFEKALADRAASDRAAHDVLGKVSVETWNKAALELKDAMWANATPAERIAAYLRADAGRQQQVVDRIDNKTDRAFFERLAAQRISHDRAAVEAGRVAAEAGRVQADTWNKAALELKDATWANATPAERANQFARLNAETQRMIVDRMDKGERVALDRVMGGRAAYDRAAHEVLGKVSVETWNKAAFELKDAMWANATTLEKVAAFTRANAETQRMIAGRVDKGERAAFDRVMADRVAQDRVASEAFGRVPAETWNKASNELSKAMWESASPLERIACFVKADAETQRKALDRMDENGRANFERMMADRAAQDRMAQRADQN